MGCDRRADIGILIQRNLPEIGIHIIDLGLVYRAKIVPEETYIQITVASPACTLYGIITKDIDKVLRKAFPAYDPTIIELAWELP